MDTVEIEVVDDRLGLAQVVEGEGEMCRERVAHERFDMRGPSLYYAPPTEDAHSLRRGTPLA